MRRSASLALLLLASACTVGPNYKQPEAPVPQAYAGPQAAVDAQGLDLAQWWQAFGDPELTRLVEIGLKQAPDLQTAESRLREARFAVVAARSQGLPSVDATGSAEDINVHQFGHSDIGQAIQQFGGQSGGSGGGTGAATGGSQTSIPHNISLFSAGFDASWELDIFGGVRRQVEAARAQQAAAVWNARDARVSFAAEIASDYLQMRGYQEQARIWR
jgi:multidrug efflux system outer membrane protein